MNEPKKLIPAYLQATNVNVGFCMYAIPASGLKLKKERLLLEKSIINRNKEIKILIKKYVIIMNRNKNDNNRKINK